MPLKIKDKKDCRWDLVSLGEIMLRLDPGDRRIATTRAFEVCEGGGEYNVARRLKRCFGLETTVVTAFADDPVGRLLQDFIFQGGVDQSLVRWVRTMESGALPATVSTSRNAVSESGPPLAPTIAATPLSLNSNPATSIGKKSSANSAPAGCTPAEFSAHFLPPRPL
jgi:sugar/nucleoside kinase (ribokinase family)